MEIEPTEQQIKAGIAAFHEQLCLQGMGWSKPEDWREEVTATLRAGLNASKEES